MNHGEIITGALLALLILVTIFLCHERGLEAQSIKTRIETLEKQIERRAIPVIQVQRATLYAGSGEIIVEDLKQDR